MRSISELAFISGAQLALVSKPVPTYSRDMASLRSFPGALRLASMSIVARLPMAALSIAVLVHVRHLTGSFATAGVVAGTFAASLGVGGPLLGRLVDRHGQTKVLLASALVAGAALAGIAALPARAPDEALVALAVVLGLGSPPVDACLRAILPAVIGDREALRAAYAAEAAAVELTWIVGPPLVLFVGIAWSTSAALVVAGAVLVAGTAVFAAQPASRAWRPAPAPERPRGGSLRAPAMRTLVLLLVFVGVVFGTVEVAVIAAVAGLGSPAAAGPLLGLWGAGSLAGGVVAARMGGGARTGAGLALMLAALAAGHLALAAAAGSAVALAAVLTLAGATIAPTYATIYAMVDHAAPAGTVTEAFAWLETAVAIGAALGAASAGSVADAAGPAAAFAVAGAAGTVAALIAALRARPLNAPSRPTAARAAA
jgi:predicted MFS family arabinose efflux permease